MSSVHAIVIITLSILLATYLTGVLRGKGIMP